MSMKQWTQALTAHHPSTNIERDFDLAKPIYEAYEDGRIKPLRILMRGTDDKPRTYLGVSGLGHKCARAAWAMWRLPTAFPGRILRLFRTGDVAEERMRHDLRAVGFELAGDQSAMSAFSGMLKGHTDGFVRIDSLPWALFEAKSSNHKRFVELQRRMREHRQEGKPEGLALRQWNEKYWMQIHVYMAAFGLDVCLYGVVDKNCDQLEFFLVERCDETVEKAGERARVLLHEDGIPSQAWDRPSTPDCTIFCDHSEWCWHGADMPVVCGSCVHWQTKGWCAHHNEARAQHEVCEAHEQISVSEDDELSMMDWA